MKRKIAIIGGGASGLMAAISAANKGADVTLYEREERVGKKILATGNGRCNLTNTAITAENIDSLGYFCFAKTNEAALKRAADFVRPTLSVWDANAIRKKFESLGLLTHELKGGMVFPQTNAASSVLDVLRFACKDAGVKFRTSSEVSQIRRRGMDFIVFAGKNQQQYDRVIIATGGASGERLLKGLGIDCERARPALVPLKTQTDKIRGLSGIRIQARVSLIKDSGEDVPQYHEEGEILFRDYGVSGIAVFNLSRFIRVNDTLSIDMFPNMHSSDLADEITRRAKAFSNRNVMQCFAGLLLPRITTAVLRECGINPDAAASSLPAPLAERVAATLKDFRLVIEGLDTTTQAQITRGGAALKEFDETTLEARLVQGLYVTGEALDIDAPCGGFNLHWAWASGLVAGARAAR